MGVGGQSGSASLRRSGEFHPRVCRKGEAQRASTEEQQSRRGVGAEREASASSCAASVSSRRGNSQSSFSGSGTRPAAEAGLSTGFPQHPCRAGGADLRGQKPQRKVT